MNSTTVVDTSFILALMNRRDNNHNRCGTWFKDYDGQLVTTPLVLAEIDYFLANHVNPEAAATFKRAVTSGTYSVTWWQQATLATITISKRYGDRELGLTDASLVVLADRLKTTTIATLDERHFRVTPPLSGSSDFKLVPIDS